MNKLITLCLLIIGLVVTGCGNAAGSGSLNTPVIYNVTPNDSSSIANSVDSDGNVTVKLTGINFGSRENGKVYYEGYKNNTTSNKKSIRLTLAYGGHWTENEISVKLLHTTIASFPSGSFYVEANGRQSPSTQTYNFGGVDLKQATVTDVSPKTFNSYDYNQGYITVTGSGFGNVSKRLTLFSMSGNTSASKDVDPLTWEDSRITFFVPNDLVTKTSNIGIKVFETDALLGHSLESSFRYVVFNPAISGTTPSSVYPGQSVTISSDTGGFGSSQPESARITINNINVTTINYWTDYSISFVIPENSYFTSGQAELKIILGSKVVNSNALTLIPHIKNVTVVKDSGFMSSTYYYTVTGYCFGSNSTLFIDNTPSSNITIKSYTNSSIVFSSTTNLAMRGLSITSGSSTQSNTVYLPQVP